MNAYRRTARRPSRRLHAGPILAFLLVASFGILFAGCGKQVTVKGPEDVPQDDITFTEEDLARFRRLAGVDEESSSAGLTGDQESSGSAEASSAPVLRAGEGSGAEVATQNPVLDLSMVKRYDALRSAGVTEGENRYRVTNAFLNVRAEQRAQSALLLRLNGGDEVTVLEFVDAKWAKVKAGETAGYAAIQYLAKVTTDDRLAQEQKAFDGLYFVSYGFVNVRAKPDPKSEKLGEIPGQGFVRPLAVEKDWARVAFQGKEGYVSMGYLAPFRPAFVVRQEKFVLPILRYAIGQPGMLDTLAAHVKALKQAGVAFTTLRDFQAVLLKQDQKQDARLPEKAVLIAITDVTPETVRKASDILYGNSVRAAFFLQSGRVGLSGITQKTLMTLLANGFDIQSAGHSGDDLRALTNTQVKAELAQSRKTLEDILGRQVFAVDYPQGGVNDRVSALAAEAGYLFGVGNAPDKQFLRSQFLRLPSYAVTTSMTAEDILQTIQ
ncbi:MAG: SH3 domain-containing protein [Patescibacteria group bacterium]